MRLKIRSTILAAAALPALGLGALAQEAAPPSAAPPSPSFDARQTHDIEGIVRNYLVAHPEVLIEAINALEAKQADQQSASQKVAIADVGEALTSTPKGTALGNPDGDVTVVEFFDYNCGYCRHALSDMDALIKTDPKVRFVLKEIPVLGPDSVAASRVSLAFRDIAPDRYGAFHRKLLGSPGVANESRALDVAAGLGVDEAEIRKAMTSPAVVAALAETNRMANRLAINGTPSYVLGDTVVPGAIGAKGLESAVGNMRRCGSASC